MCIRGNQTHGSVFMGWELEMNKNNSCPYPSSGRALPRALVFLLSFDGINLIFKGLYS